MRNWQRSLSIAVQAVVLVAGVSTMVSGESLILDSALTIGDPATYDSIVVQSHGRLTADAPLTVSGNLIIDSGGVVTHSPRLEQGLVLNVTGTINVRASGSINLNEKGLRGGLNGSVFGVDGEAYDSTGAIVAGAEGGPYGSNPSGAGASYGGLGANSEVVTNVPYGHLENPQFLGAGGGGATIGSRPGGHGGGRLTITAGSLVVDGTIRANGGNGVGANPQSGGGSGGSIWIEVGSLGGTGTIQAIGGLGVNSFPTPSGSGSGGRIAIFYESNGMVTSLMSARGGGGVRPGSAGTIYLKNNTAAYGDLIIDNDDLSTALFTPLMTQVNGLGSVVVKNAGRLAIDSAVTIAISNTGDWDLNIESAGVVELMRQSVLDATTVRVNNGTLNTHVSLGFPDGAALELSSGGTINVSDSAIINLGYFTPANVQSGTVSIPSGCRLDVASGGITVGGGVTLIKDGLFGIADQLTELTIDSGGVVTHSPRFLDGLVLDITGTLDIAAGGFIDLNRKGLRGGSNGSVFGVDGEAFDSTGAIVVGALGGPYGSNPSGAGASYGGFGANSEVATNQPYGYLENPQFLGAGGGGATIGSRPGGHGGGRATISAGTLIVNGTMRANGGNGVGANPQSGGGSGGSILVNASVLSGSGTIEATGGLGFNSFPTPSGSGGGGRIAIFYDTNNMETSHITARGGGGARPGSEGTIYLKGNAEAYGDLILDNGSLNTSLATPLLTDLSRFANLLLRHRGRLWLRNQDVSTLTVEEPVLVADTSGFILDFGVTTEILNSEGFDLNIENGSTVRLNSGTILNASAIRAGGGSLTTYIDLSFPNGADFELSANGSVTVDSGATFDLGYFDHSNIESGIFDLNAGCRLDVATSDITIGNGVTLIKDGVFGVSDQVRRLVIDSIGVVTHSTRLEQGLVLEIIDTFDISAGGMIDLNAKGLRGGLNGSVFGVDGEAYDSLGTIVVGALGGPYGSNPSGAGASYGGFGANSEVVTNEPYGKLENPQFLGAGGGGATMGSRPGGHGGGRATITAGTLIVNGTIRANGGNGVGANPQSGAGSGGSIKIDAGMFSGSGAIEAVGGLGFNSFPTPSGSGSGGRIAIFYESGSFPDANVTAHGGGGARPGSAGTVYLKSKADTFGDVFIDNGSLKTNLASVLLTDLLSIANLRISHAGRLWLRNPEIMTFAIDEPVFVTDTSALFIDSGTVVNVLNAAGTDLNIGIGSEVDVRFEAKLDADAIVINGGLLTVAGDMQVDPGDTLSILAGGKLVGMGRLNQLGGSTTLQNGTVACDSAVHLNGGTFSGSGSSLSNIFVTGGTLHISDSLVVTDTLFLDGGALYGTGIIHGSVRNSSILNPGSSYGIVTIDGDYIQTAGGELSLDIAGLQEGTAFDKLKVVGTALLDGILRVTLDNGFVPAEGDRFRLVGFDSLSGSFASIDGLDSNLAVVRIDTCLVLIAGSNVVTNSFSDPVMILSPAGSVPFGVHLRDAEGAPVVGVDNVWLDFSGVSGLASCGTEPLWPIVTPLTVSDESGAVTFSPRAGGCSSDSVAVMTSFGVIDKVPIRSLDVSGGLLVTPRDFEGGECNDYNNDGITDAADWTFFEKFLGLSCLDDATNYALLAVYTEPGPHDIYQGDTIQICAKISNVSNESIQVDSVDFYGAGWGIARPWTRFARETDAILAGGDSIILKQPFVVPESHHGCFKVRIYPRFLTRRSSSRQGTLSRDVFTTSLSGFSADGATVSQVVGTLRRIYGLPINFIQAPYEMALHMGVFEGSVAGFLDVLVAHDPGYTYESIGGRLIVRPSDSLYDRIIGNVELASMSRRSATRTLIGALRDRVPELAELASPGVIGNRSGRMYTDPITIGGKGRVVDHLVQLLGDDPALSFAIEPMTSGRMGLSYYGQFPPAQSAAGCSDCRPTGITEANANFVPCGGDSCGSVLLVDITGVTVQCCPGDTKCDCEGGMETEEVTTTGDCIAGTVETGDGCPIGAGGAIADCLDEYALCIPKSAWPADSCKQTLIQNIKVCDRLIQTISISWTLRRSGDTCTAEAPSRQFGTPAPPPSCDSTPSIEKQINRDALKRPRSGMSATMAREPGVTHFDIPLGSEFGDSLYLFRLNFLPDGWSFTVSDSGWVRVPDTIGVDITHPDHIPEQDSARVIFYAYNDGDEYAGTAEVMVYNPSVVVDVDETEEQSLPVSFELVQNYPNPFNPATTIEYSVPSRAHVCIDIFNIVGQKVKTLVDREEPAGSYTITWNGTSDSGAPLATGIYLYRFQAADHIQTKKMLLLK